MLYKIINPLKNLYKFIASMHSSRARSASVKSNSSQKPAFQKKYK